jgi:hypothetical protein
MRSSSFSNPAGNFLCVLDTSAASDGVYVVTAMALPASGSGRTTEVSQVADSVSFMILAGAPQRARKVGTESAPTLAVAAGTALPYTNSYLPSIQR